jgi:glycosyltransferase involved in cell wall biosynthesis/2-polyprenyl-3-methyl-5-hydroxy-6-metoxy-1,4-benzoquinol methylase
MSKRRVLIFIVAYNHEKLITSVLDRIPASLSEYDTEILIIDDASADRTFETAVSYKRERKPPFGITVLVNPKNQRYGGNQKIGFQYAIENGFDALALVHGDGQYAPEALPELLAPIMAGEVDGVMGSRMATRFGALKGGMPFYKYVGNKILTAYQNLMLGTDLYEFHTGYRLYSVNALQRIPFDLATNEFHFDNEIYIQMLLASMRVKELPIDTFYGNEVCHVEGFRYAWDIVKTTTVASLQKTSLFYRRKYDLSPPDAASNSDVPSKLEFRSSHSLAVDRVAAGSNVLNIGTDGGHVARKLKEKSCRVTGIDPAPAPKDGPFESYTQAGVNDVTLPESLKDFDTVVMMDVIGRFGDPDRFMQDLGRKTRPHPDLRVVAINGNVAFITNRLLVTLGNFNYGKRGILDLTHRRLFTVASLKRLFDGYGFEIEEVLGIPAPFPLLFGDNAFSRALLTFNIWLIALSKGLFAYQVCLVAKPRPSLPWLLAETQKATVEREQRPRVADADATRSAGGT